MATYNIDAKERILGRLATEIVLLLRGKDSPDFAPNKNPGNVVMIENADKIAFSGKKFSQNKYFSHSGYARGERYRSLKDTFAKMPEEVLRRAVLGMLPHNRLSQQLIKNLKFKKN